MEELIYEDAEAITDGSVTNRARLAEMPEATTVNAAMTDISPRWEVTPSDEAFLAATALEIHCLLPPHGSEVSR